MFTTGTTDLMNAPEEQLTQRTYNLNGMSFTPREQAWGSIRPYTTHTHLVHTRVRVRN